MARASSSAPLEASLSCGSFGTREPNRRCLMRTRTVTSLVAISAFAWIALSKPVTGQSTEYTAGGIAFDWCGYEELFHFCTISVLSDNDWQNVGVGIQPRWSPDGNRIVFLGIPEYDSGEILVVNVGNLSVVNVTNHPAIDWAPTWSSDGTKIAFLSDRTGATVLYSVNHDGTNLVSLTSVIGFSGEYAWAPTDNTIAIL